jgi:hypothetical protein
VIGFITNEFHEFCCLFICRWAFVEIHIKGLKMCKITKHKYHSTQVQRREAHNHAKQGPKERRIRLNPNQTA